MRWYQLKGVFLNGHWFRDRFLFSNVFVCFLFPSAVALVFFLFLFLYKKKVGLNRSEFNGFVIASHCQTADLLNREMRQAVSLSMPILRIDFFPCENALMPEQHAIAERLELYILNVNMAFRHKFFRFASITFECALCRIRIEITVPAWDLTTGYTTSSARVDIYCRPIKLGLQRES